MGKRIGKYEIGKTLGSGNFSKVKQATDVENGSLWAMKIIEKEQLQRDHMEEQLKREIALMKQLKHPHIVQLREVMQTQNHIYLVLELVTGGELFDKIVSSKRLSEDIARRYFQQLVMAVRCCHQAGVAHRDLKPENLLLDGNDNIKISDFGLSNLQPNGQADLLQTVCGTPNYVAPEVLREKGYNGFKADAWSCGVVLFVMLAGYLPFDDPNINALFNKIERGDYRMARHFSPQAADLISKLLVTDPNTRFTMDQVVTHPWFQQGLDQTTLAVSFNVSDPTADEMANLITKTAEPVDTPGNSASPNPSASRATTVDAFDIMSQLTAVALGPFSKQPDIPKTAPPTVTAPGGGASLFHQHPVTVLVKNMTIQQIQEVINKQVKMSKIEGHLIRTLQLNGGLVTAVTLAVYPTTLPGTSVVEMTRTRGDAAAATEMMKKYLAALGTNVTSQVAEDPL